MRVTLSGLVVYPQRYMDKAPKHVGVRWVGVALGQGVLVETSSQLTPHTILQKNDSSSGQKCKKETLSDCFGSAGTRTQAGADLDRMVLTPSPATTRRHTPRPHHRGGTLMKDHCSIYYITYVYVIIEWYGSRPAILGPWCETELTVGRHWVSGSITRLVWTTW
jgi:hypothetical protein